jgi:hypothetical protein
MNECIGENPDEMSIYALGIQGGFTTGPLVKAICTSYLDYPCGDKGEWKRQV